MKWMVILAALCLATPGSTQAQFSPSAHFSDDVLHSFVQDAPNCASEAIAKTLIGNYGLESKAGVFLDQVPDATGVSVTLRSHETVRISNVQMDAAKHNSHFVLRSDSPSAQKILDTSNLIYAAIAVRAIDHGTGPLANLGTLDSVFERLYKGVDADYLFDALGYKIDDSKVGPDAPLAYLFGNAVHAVFATGTNFDQYGGPLPLDLFWSKHPARGPVWRYTVVSTAVAQTPTVTLACKLKEGRWQPGNQCG